MGGLAIAHGTTVPIRAQVHSLAAASASGEVVVEGAPLAFHVYCEARWWR